MTGREQQLNFYYSADARRLHRIVDSILLKFGGLSDKDRDDFTAWPTRCLWMC